MANLEMNVLWTINNLHSISCMKQTSLTKLTLNVKYIAVPLKHHSKKDSGTILEISNMSALNRIGRNFQIIFRL